MDLVGVVFERLTVLEKDTVRDSNGSSKWVCKCICGNIKSISQRSLRGGATRSCGCLNREICTTHGLSKHRLYVIYKNVIERCTNPSTDSYKYYGGRGITICDYWLEGFMNFYNDMLPIYNESLELDRIDGDKGYYKENCRWITHQQNLHNTRPKDGGSSKYKGVSKGKGCRKYEANIYKDGKLYKLGTFTCEKEAALAYNKKALELNGEFAYMNKVE